MTALRVLHVEDDALDRLLLRDWLERAGLAVEVTEAATAGELLEALAAGTFDLVVTDNRLPDLSAARAIEAVRDRLPGIPVIVLTGGMSDHQVSAVLAAGANACFDKQDRDGIVRAIAAIAGRDRSLG